jgi:hypothetical protein
VSISDPGIPQAAVLRIDPASSIERRTEFVQWMVPFLAHLNWRAQLFLVADAHPDQGESIRATIEVLARFVLDSPLVTFFVHPLVRIGSPDATDTTSYRTLLGLVRPLLQHAYQQQGEPRLQILPILEPKPDTADEDWLKAAQYCHTRLAPPSVLLRGSGALRKARSEPERGIRYYIEPEVGSGAAGMTRQLWRAHVFECVVERPTAEGSAPQTCADAGLLAPCRSHVIVDQCSGSVYSCYRDWMRGRPLAALEDGPAWAARMATRPAPTACAECISESALSMADNLIANGRQPEGSQVNLRLALAFCTGMQA